MLTDALMNDYGVNRVVILLAKELMQKYDVSIVSVKISKDMFELLKSSGLDPVDLEMKLFSQDSSRMMFESYLHEGLFSLNSKKINKMSRKDSLLMSFSCIFNMPTDIVYGQGLGMGLTLKAVVRELPVFYKVMVKLTTPFFSYADEKLIKNLHASGIIITNSKYCANLYKEAGLKVNDIIYPPIDCSFFRPTTAKPTKGYVLVYFGKETEFPIIRKVADSGVKIKGFGMKLKYMPPYLRNHPNIEFCGHVMQDELINLYSNANFTLFPFTDEVFGYVPVESMACGTPVVTYAQQGPAETVVDGVTGWLASSHNEIIELALKLDRVGYPNAIREECRKHSLRFDSKHIAKKWEKNIENLLLNGHVSMKDKQ